MNNNILNISKRKLYITSGEYNSLVPEKRVKKHLDLKNINIELNESEEKLFKLLIDYTIQNKLDTIIRVAGGWVRDKVLDFINKRLDQFLNFDNENQTILYSKKDIDIALNDLPGKVFAEGFNNWLQKYHNYPKHSVGIINRDPEKSKHLETATLLWNDICIDFVGLRSETYTLESRIPTINIGTAEEDAFRRDFTINSMFYNIKEKKIEDLTKMGLMDLYNKIIRTPLDPIKTLLDDPLRALRAFRFSSRLHFRMEEGLLRACKEELLCDALKTKISRERIGSEIHEMISNSHVGNPAIGLKLVVQTNLVDSVFKFPDNEVIYSYYNKNVKYYHYSQFGDWYCYGPYIVELTHRIIELLMQINSFDYEKNVYINYYKTFQELLSFDKAYNWGVSTYFSFMLPLYHYYYKNQKKKEILLIKYVLSDSLKLSNKITNSITLLFDSCLKIINRIIKVNSINQLVNKTLKNSFGVEIDVYSDEIINSSSKELTTGLWSFYKTHFKVYLKNKNLIKYNIGEIEFDELVNYKNVQEKIELGIFVWITGKLWIEMLISLFCLDIVYLSAEHKNFWADKELLRLFFSHPYFGLIKKIIDLKLSNCYEFKNPVDGKLINNYFPELSKGPKYKFIINFSFLWFIAFTENINNLTQLHILKCINFIKENCGHILDKNYHCENFEN